ncbi:glutamine synthetase/guanido kinase [Daedalea quercina L-15889]|uniref:Glutamine synthetase/guanido kinase n=1 Tax=Daedalea quercina L-15889 TaxID=1314783 RepID=A0A165LLZ3_9APHY|nr:glutamine synthetase/guanido kinase [Daedalea quercina L-15889]
MHTVTQWQHSPTTPRFTEAPTRMGPAVGRTRHQICLGDNIKYVRVQWVDFSNTLRFHVIPAPEFSRLCKDARPSMRVTARTLGLVNLRFAKGFDDTAERLYVFDLDSFRVCAYAPGHASVMGWFQRKTPSPEGDLVQDTCPRTLLQRVVRDAKTKAGFTFLCGFESEFILLSTTSSEPIPIVEEGWCSSAKLRTGSVHSVVLEEIADSLQTAGIEVLTYHAEGAAGQFEVVTGPLPPLEAVDTLVHTRETIYNVASKHGLRATFAPRVSMKGVGSGQHVHISLKSSRAFPDPDTSAEIVKAPTLTFTVRSFLQGLVEHLPALCALMLPTPQSYWRVRDGISSGGTYACWGAENKEVPLRLCGDKGSHRVEVKTPDGTSNPYLVVASLLAAGVHGVLTGEKLKVGNCVKPVACMNNEEKKKAGIDDASKLPRSIQEARKLFEEDDVLREVLRDDCVDKYISVNECCTQLLGEFMAKPLEEESVNHLLKYY